MSTTQSDNKTWYIGAAVIATAAAAAAGYYYLSGEEDDKDSKKKVASSASSTSSKATQSQKTKQSNDTTVASSSSDNNDTDAKTDPELKGGSNSSNEALVALDSALSSQDQSTNIERQDSDVFFNPSSSSFIENTPNDSYEATLERWTKSMAQAEQMIPIIGSLYRDNNVVLHMYGRGLVNLSATDITKVHKFCQRYVKDNTFGNLETTLNFLECIHSLGPGPSKLDIGLLIHNYYKQEEKQEVQEYLKQELSEALEDNGPLLEQARDVVLYGFGRIGRLLARILIHKIGGGDKLRLRAIVVRRKMDTAKDLEKRASLLRRDSTHGQFK
eukprot:TRINITY_DN3462_c0_g1_i1.p1 TRINITY_DN3462_c0_g1~~TRINITY_DN3462_c0_g1_i1.p1  ORF type:complete len:358 (+),score=121.61 TRINITY_DN3462_c0_g1_i1:90-1076(+)